LSSGGPESFEYDLCFQPNAGGALTNFTGGNYSIGQATTVRHTFTAAASVRPGVGTWKVGYCTFTQGAALDNNDYVNGWVMVTN
jgi:hypothetical protein